MFEQLSDWCNAAFRIKFHSAGSEGRNLVEIVSGFIEVIAISMKLVPNLADSRPMFAEIR